MSLQTVLDYTLFYAAKGVHVFPCHLNKTPMTPHGFKDATTDPTQIRQWWNADPQASIGAACGASGWLVLDVDTDKGGKESFLQLQRDGILTTEDMETLSNQTGSGGYHLIWQAPADVKLGNSAGKLGVGLDTRGDGGYIILPPSDHPSGNKYEILVSKAPRPMPAKLIELLKDKPIENTHTAAVPIPRNPNSALYRTYEKLAGAAEGTRNDTLNRAGFYLFCLVREGKLFEGEVREILEAGAKRAGLADNEIRATIQSAYRGAMAG